MKTNKRNGNILRAAAALIVLACLVMSCNMSIRTWASEVDEKELTGKIFEGECSLAVYAADPVSEIYEDIESADVVIDVYRVADAISDPLYDTYSFRMTDAFSSLEIKNDMDHDSWDDLAQEAAYLIAAGDISAVAENAPESSRIPGNADESISSGLYLIIAHGADMTSKSEYLRYSDQEERASGTATDETAEKAAIESIAYSDEYVYSFRPLLVSLPGKGDLTDMKGVMNTSDRSDWKEDVTVYLKPSRTNRLTGIRIIKTLTDHIGPGDASFVFSIVAETGEGENIKRVFSRVVMMSFSSAGEKSIALEDIIPVGARVTVTEEYEGGSYRLVFSDDMPAVSTADELIEFRFVNEPDSYRRGGSVVNRFTGPESGDWIWEQLDDESDGTKGGYDHENP